MPITSPSYFPPNRANGSIIGITAGKNAIGARCFLGGQSAGNNSTVNDLIVIGNDALMTAITDVNLAGSICIGTNTCTALISSGTGGPGANTVIGLNALEGMLYGSANVVIGDNAAQLTPGTFGATVLQNVVIGSNAAVNAGTGSNTRLQDSVIIGYESCLGVAGSNEITASVIIGASTCPGYGGIIGSSVVIGGDGAQSLATLGNVQSVIVIGASTTGGTGAGGLSNCVYIGTALTMGNASTQTVVIGDSANDSGNTANTAIGDHVNTLGGTYNIVIGSNAGRGLAGSGLNNKLIVEVGLAQSVNPTQRLIYGDFGSQGGATNGTLIFGNSQHGVNDDMVGQNTVKLLNGVTGGATHPVGGGYFYVSAGALHWVGSSGTDTTIAVA